jgi:hypothetical protein
MNKSNQDILMHILREIVGKYFLLLPFYGIGRTVVLIASGTGVGVAGGVLGIMPYIGAGFFAYWGLGFVTNLAYTPLRVVPCTPPAIGECLHLPQTNYATLVIGVAVLIAVTIVIEYMGYEIQDSFGKRMKVELPEFKD